MLLVFVIAAAVAVVGSSSVSADSCVAQLGYSSLSTTQYYYNSNIGINMPVSASCSSVAGQLYAVGDAYDTAVNTDLGQVNTMLTPVYGSSNYNGQLTFNLPSTILGHPVQISVSIYSGSPYGYGGGGNGLLLATAAQRVQVDLNNDQNGYYQSCGYYSGCSNPPPSGYYPISNCYQNSYCYYPGYVPSSSYVDNYNYCNLMYGPTGNTGNSNTVRCYGYLYQDSNGCIELVAPLTPITWRAQSTSTILCRICHPTLLP